MGCFTACVGGRTGRETPGPRRTASPSPALAAALSASPTPGLDRTESVCPSLHPPGVSSSCGGGGGASGGGGGSLTGSGHARVGSGVDLHTLLSHVMPSKEAAIKVPPVATGGETR